MRLRTCRVQSFFDKVDHDRMIQFVEHRIADKRIVRLIQKWLKAGVMRFRTQAWKTVGGSRQRKGLRKGRALKRVISPILANLYLHYVLDALTHASVYGWRRGGRSWRRVI